VTQPCSVFVRFANPPRGFTNLGAKYPLDLGLRLVDLGLRLADTAAAAIGAASSAAISANWGWSHQSVKEQNGNAEHK
jgi:uncharacterized protein (DUF697 family)